MKLCRFFTLLELLIVIAIIGILVTLLMPSLGKARVQAMKAVCLSNQKQISTAYAVYRKNNRGFFPLHHWRPPITQKHIDNGTSPLLPYTRNAEFTKCPADKGDVGTNAGVKAWQHRNTSYQFAARTVLWGVDWVTTNNANTGSRQADYFDNPAIKIVFGDIWHANRDWTHKNMQWHGGKNYRSCNMSFLDSHAKFFSFPTEYNTFPGRQAPDQERGFY